MAQKLVATDTSPGGLLKSLPKWEQIARKDQIIVERATKNLGEALADLGRSKLAIGEHLAEVQEKLEPLKLFSRYLKAFRFKRSVAYNHITAYRNAAQNLPEPVLRRAMLRNMSIIGLTEDKPLGRYTNAFKRLPPPNTDDQAKIDQYLDTIEEAALRTDARSKKYVQEVAKEPALLRKQLYKFAKRCLSQLPETGNRRRDTEQRGAFIEDVMGMLLSELGISRKTIEAQAVPEEFKVGPGRPRKEDEAA